MAEAPSRSAGSIDAMTVVRIVVTTALVAAVWWPARPGASDGFPLSTYPMFAEPRSGTSVVQTVLGVLADGRRRPLTPELVGGTPRGKQALATVRLAVRQGQAESLCDQVAQRVTGDPGGSSVIALEVVTDTWDTLGSIEPGATPTTRQVHARCEVP